MKDIINMQLNIIAGSTIDKAIDTAFMKLEDAEIVSFDFNGIKFAINKTMKKEDVIKYWDMATMAEKWYTRY